MIADLHPRQHFLPAAQDLVDLEGHRLATGEGTVELKARSGNRAPVVDADFAGGRGAAAAAGFDHPVLDAVGQRLDTGLAAVFGQEAVALGLVLGRHLLQALTRLTHHLFLVGDQILLHFRRRHGRFTARVGVLQAADHGRQVDIGLLVAELAAKLEADGVAQLVLVDGRCLPTLGSLGNSGGAGENESRGNRGTTQQHGEPPGGRK